MAENYGLSAAQSISYSLILVEVFPKRYGIHSESPFRTRIQGVKFHPLVDSSGDVQYGKRLELAADLEV
jgi:hypothetical protein